MKKANLKMVAALLVAMLLFVSCTETSRDKEQESNRYNICLILDGSDRLSKQNCIPQVSVEQILEIAQILTSNGTGSFYVCYVDENCDNNEIALLEFQQEKPIKLRIEDKPSYMKMAEYKKLAAKYHIDSLTYSSGLANTIEKFTKDCEKICRMAYSNEVAKQKNGSDVNGAINQAIRLLRASEHQTDFSYIVLVSDGCDNIGKDLTPIPESTKLFTVNTNVAKHQYGELVSKEFVTLEQVTNQIFNNKCEL